MDRTAQAYNDAIAKKLAKVGWHPSNPELNGMVVPKKLKIGGDFHNDTHPKYSKEIYFAVGLITGSSENQILERMKKLAKMSQDLIEKAYKNNKPLNDAFDGIIINLNKIDNIVL